MASLSRQQVTYTIGVPGIYNGSIPDSKSSAVARILNELIQAKREPVPFVSFRVEHDDLVCISAAYIL